MSSRLLAAILLIFFGLCAEASADVPEPGEAFQIAQRGLNQQGALKAAGEQAKKKTKYEEPLPTWSDIEFNFGFRIGGGGDLWLTPNNAVYSPNDDFTFAPQPFNELRAGYDYTVGFFGDLRLFRYLGVESGVVLTRRTLVEETDWKYSPDDASVARAECGVTGTCVSHSKETLTWGEIRIPVMFRFIAPVGENHLWFGAGPEFHFGQWTKGTFSLSGDPLKGSYRGEFQKTLEAGESPIQGQTTTDTWLTFGFGYMIQAARNLRVPIDLRFGWNPDQPRNYFDRMTYCNDKGCSLPNNETEYPNKVFMKAQSTMYGEILVGLTYNIY